VEAEAEAEAKVLILLEAEAEAEAKLFILPEAEAEAEAKENLPLPHPCLNHKRSPRILYTIGKRKDSSVTYCES